MSRYSVADLSTRF